MANITKTLSGKWRFQVTVNYKARSKVFNTKGEGYAWEEELKTATAGKIPNLSFGELLDKYVRDVSVNKKGERWERIRVEKFNREDGLAKIKIASLTKAHFADWRDRRLKEVSALSVLREWALLNHCLHIAVNEWEYLPDNPMAGLKKPRATPPRDRLVSDAERDRLFAALNYADDVELKSVTSRVGAAFAFALESAMRAQEICNLKWSDISGSVAKVNASKTFAGIRQVPLSSDALSIIDQCKGLDDELVFNIRTSQLDAIFRKAKKNALVEGLHFHDSRATAITNLAKKLDILDLARVCGHKDLKMLMVYYRESASDIAKRLG